ncbi:MAG: hypothetical protein M9894_29490 [Planctomycetes bacterium]|nr:hypothetical protein [Planctomycetota bacterium]
MPRRGGRGRVGRRFVLRGAAAAGLAGAAALVSSSVLLHEHEAPARRVVVARAPLPGAGSSLVALATGGGAPGAAPTRESSGPAPGRPSPVVHVAGLTRGGPQGERAFELEALQIEGARLDRLEQAVRREPDLGRRLAALDEVTRSLPADRAIALLERLLDRPCGASGDELRSFRMGALGRLGAHREHPAAERRLLRVAADAQAPRPERLMALEALRREGGVLHSARPALERVASSDPDVIVRQRASWALGETG